MGGFGGRLQGIQTLEVPFSALSTSKFSLFRFIYFSFAFIFMSLYFSFFQVYFFSRNIFDQNIQDDIESKGKVKIEEDVWIGTNSVILNGVKIGRGSVIAANSTVTKDIPRYSICIGNNIVRKRFPKNVIEKLEEMKWWDWEVEKILKNKDLFIGPINNVMQ